MYITNGIAYADDAAPCVEVSGVRPLDGHKLWVRFNTGESKIFDFSPLLKTPAFAPLADAAIFAGAYTEYGAVQWNDGAIDIAPEYLYEFGAAE